ncbi:MAG: hypothetical protein M3442_10520 [Chloroflexota bacterium]|nr:hypothetical protein [Chloroflexota bacterium]
MAGTAKDMIDTLIQRRSKGNATIASTTRTRLILKGIKVDGYTATSPDDPAIIARIRELATEWNIRV